MHLLLVEDDLQLAEEMKNFLQKHGFTVQTADSGVEAVGMVDVYKNYDLIVLDVNLPDINGKEVIRRLRGANCQIPILMASGVTESQSKIDALNEGADDYISKPFDFQELVARVLAVIRRSCGYSASKITLGNLTLDLNKKIVTCSKQSVNLTKKEYSMLELLLLRKGVALSKSIFLDYIYGDGEVPNDKIIDVYICKLRKKLDSVSPGKEYIHTIWGQGYIMRDPDAAVVGASEHC